MIENEYVPRELQMVDLVRFRNLLKELKTMIDF